MSGSPRLGFGLYRHMLTPENYRFARQAGATDVVVHLVDYTGQLRATGGAQNHDQPVSDTAGWGYTDGDRSVWAVDSLRALKADMDGYGLRLHGIENFDPAHWYDVLLGGPKRDEQIEWLCEIIENLGAAGIPVMGYNFSIAGVASRVQGPFARGGARSVGVQGIDETPIPEGMVWNMTYRRAAGGAGAGDGRPSAGSIARVPPATHDELWERLRYFLQRLLPVAERAGVVLAAHPDDPPAAFVRGQPRLVYRPDLYYKLFDLVESPASKAEFCLGSIQEMPEGDIYALTEDLARRDRIGYVHFRNVVGKVPHYHEVFVDEGDVDLKRIMNILRSNGYSGVVIPDHTPQMSCDAPWHSGMAFAMGYMSALL